MSSDLVSYQNVSTATRWIAAAEMLANDPGTRENMSKKSEQCEMSEQEQKCTVRGCGHIEKVHNYALEQGNGGKGCRECYIARVPLGQEWAHEFTGLDMAEQQLIDDIALAHRESDSLYGIGGLVIEGIDLDMLEKQRKHLNGNMHTLSESNGYDIAITADQQEALSGIENMLDEWSDIRGGFKPEPATGAQADYQMSPSLCPFCKSSEIEGQGVEIDNGMAQQEVSCNDCEKSWSDIYTLIHYEERTDA